MTNLAIPPEPQQTEFFNPPEIPDSFKKAVGVVQVAMGKLGFLHRKLYNVMLANAYKGLGEGGLHFSIQVSDLADLSGFDSRDYQLIYDHCRELLRSEVEFIEFDNKENGKKRKRKRRGATNLISDFSVSEGGLITYSYSREMAEKLDDPEQFIWMALSIQNKFSSKYELSLFENCVRYLKVGTTGFKDVADWRDLFGATEDTYQEFKHFNGLVIKPAAKGVSEKSGIIVEPEFEREKRKVSRIKFNIRENPQTQLLDYKEHKKIRATEAFTALREAGLSDVESIYWIAVKGEVYAQETLAYVKDKKPNKNATGYLVSALKNGYGEKTPEQRKNEHEARQKTKKLAQKKETEKAAEAKQKSLEEHFKKHQEYRAKELLIDRESRDLEKLVSEVTKKLPTVIKSYRQRWFEINKNIEALTPEIKATDRLIWVGYVVPEVLKLWGKPQDLNLESFKNLN